MPPRPFLSATLVAALSASALAGSTIESHSIDVKFDPEKSRIEAVDVMHVVRDPDGTLDFRLNAALEISAVTVDGVAAVPKRTDGGAEDAWTATWRVDIPATEAPTHVVKVTYAGTIADSVKKSETLSFVVGDDTRGVICADGVYLSEGSRWYPAGDGMSRFDVKASIPEPYLVVTQGTRNAATGVWSGKYDADGLALVAGKWKHEERKSASGVVVGTYLTEANAASAKLLLDATEKYLGVYAALLGPYAYDRFDVVENWFTTGYGMPEFTLLGRDVIARMVGESQRLGAIPSGYLDHEIVHSWWGNLVFPDYANGNWCEGLTSYCANYFSQEAIGPAEAREYRRRSVLRYTIGTSRENDYPVRKFQGKSTEIDDDIGYGKCSMFFHALRRDIGDEPFWETLRRVARDNRGKRFAWSDWQREFEKSSKRNLAATFTQGLDRTGAPLFAVRETDVSADGGRLRVSGTLEQILAEGEEPWRITVPVVVEHLEGVEETLVDCAGATTRFSLLVPSLPLRVTIDPDFNVFRRLADDEVPACLAATIARPRKVVVYPDGDDALKAAAEMAAARSGGTAVAASEAPAEPARGVSYLVFGDTARVPMLASLAKTLPRHFPSSRASETTTILATARSPADPAQFVTTFVGKPAATAKRARAVFYYQYDGRIVFDGPVPKERGQVATVNHATRTLLPDVKAASSPEAVRALVDLLAAPEMNGRLAGGPEEKKVRAMIAEQFTLAGLSVDEQEFAFTVKSRDAAPALFVDDLGVVVPPPAPGDPVVAEQVFGGTGVVGASPLVASPATPMDGQLLIQRVETEPSAELNGCALLVDVGAGQEDVLATLRSTAELAKSRGAVALIVRLPKEPTKEMLDLTSFAGDVVATSRDAPAPLAPYAAAGIAARTGSTRDLALPAVAVPNSFDAKALKVSMHVRFKTQEIATSNLVARIKALGKHKRPGVVVLGAHYDHLGAGSPGADDDASGIAALTEAARVLSANTELLGRDVVLVAFGAEEWGLRGSRAFLDAWPKDQPIVAMINADTVGRRGVGDVNVVGISKHPRLGRIVSAALEQANLVVGGDIDRFAFAWGSDHFTFHEAGIAAVDLWSGDYAVMHTAADTPDGVDETKVSRIGRALAMAALGVAGGF